MNNITQFVYFDRTVDLDRAPPAAGDLAVGSRVVRGPDWRYYDQVGTVRSSKGFREFFIIAKCKNSDALCMNQPSVMCFLLVIICDYHIKKCCVMTCFYTGWPCTQHWHCDRT